MSDHSDHEKKKSENLVKSVSGEANELVHKTVDASGNIVRTFAGEDGLITKTYDASGNVIKSVSSKGNEYIGKTMDTSSKILRGATKRVTHRRKKD